MAFQPLVFSGFTTGGSSGGGGGGSPTIGGAVVGGTAGSVLFVGTGNTLSQDNANFNYNSTTHALAITGILSASNISGTLSGSSSGTNTGDITLGTPSGLSLVGQVLSLALSSTSTTGALSSTDWNTFNSKQGSLTPGSISTTTTGITIANGANSTVSPNVTINIQNASTSQNGLLTSTDWNTFNSKQASGSYVTTSEVGSANGVASLDPSGKIPSSQLPSTVLQYEGLWNPSTNTPTLQDSTGINGYVYQISTNYALPIAGLNNSTMVNFQVGNLVIYSSSLGQWEQAASASGVSSVNGAQGVVTVNAINQLTGDVTAGPASGSQSEAATIASIQGTTVSGTTGTGSVVFSNSPTLTGTLTAAIGMFSGAISASNFSGTITGINTGDVTLGTANGLSLVGQVLSLGLSSTSTTGALSSTDWNTFNNKLNTGLALLLTGGSPTGPITSSSTITASNISGSTSGTNTGDQTITLTGAVNGSGTGTFATTLTNASVTGQPLTGFTSGPDSPVLATDSILQGLQKLQAQINSSPVESAGDINEMLFNAANNQSSPANVTGFLFSNAVVRSFQALVSVYINATAPLYEVFELQGIQRAADWQMSASSTGDSSGIVFSITTSGQIQYISSNISGFTSDTMKFRAITTSL